jgi:LPS export ABC transporter protein LptC
VRAAGFVAALIVAVAACQETGARPVDVVSAPDTADQVMEGFSHYVTNQGVRRSRVEADTAFFYEAAQSNDLRNVRVVFYDLQGGEGSTLTAKRGRYYWQDGKMEAHGDVVVVSPDGRRLRTESLRYDNASNMIWTDKPFRFERGTEYLEGNSFRSDPDFRNVVTDRPRGASGEGILLPGQTGGDEPPAPPQAPPTAEPTPPKDSV